ncbi:MAG: SDR family oxidoreductase [Lachnospiraceae bacterium]|nr:SDR family oxidoreductase [Lachnospiraceae bacterium]
MKKVAVVTGASSGIGEAAAKMLLEKGYTVYGLSRRGTCPEGAVGLSMDVTDEARVKTVFREIREKEGRIDLLINNAGFGISGPVEFTETADAFSQMNVNFFGQFLCAREVLPYMREQKSGRIVFTSSVAASMAIPYQSFYSASKAAVNSVALALRNEVKDFGITVTAVMPGDVHTGFTDARVKDTASGGVYKRSDSAVAAMEKDERNGMTPEFAAGIVVKAALKKHPKPLYIAGPKYQVFYLLFKLLPARLVYWVIGKMYS